MTPPETVTTPRRRALVAARTALRWATSTLVRQLAGVVALWFAYVFTVDTVSGAVTRDPAQGLYPDWNRALLGYIRDINHTPPLARFDSVWYYSQATEGYAPHTGWGRMNASFMPLYGLLMRWVGRWLGVDPYLAGAYVSRAALLVGMVFLYLYARDKRTAGSPPPWAPVVAMLFFPTGYILVSVYSESLFFMFCVATFFFAERKHYATAFVLAFLAGLTRAHVVALIAALGIFGLVRWRPKQWRTYLGFLPVAGATSALGAMAYYFKREHHDVWHYFEVKKTFGLVNAGPKMLWPTTLNAVRDARTHGHFGSLYTFMEVPAMLLLVVGTAVLLRQKKWAEAAFVGTTFALQAVTGSLWGMPRYTILLFPLFMLLARLQRRPMVWHAYLFAGVMLQTCIMINYINLRAPAP